MNDSHMDYLRHDHDIRIRAILVRICAPEDDPYAASSMVLLARLAKQVMRRSSAELLGMDLRLLMALSYLGDHDGAPQQELVDALCMDAKNVVLLLNELEERRTSRPSPRLRGPPAPPRLHHRLRPRSARARRPCAGGHRGRRPASP